MWFVRVQSKTEKRAVAHTKTLGAALDELIEKLGIRKKLREQDVFLIWPEVVGDRIAQVTTPVRIVRGTLVISVRTSAWRNELTMRKREIIDRLNEVMAEEIVKELKFQ